MTPRGKGANKPRLDSATIDVGKIIRTSLERVPGILCVFIYGPFADRGEAHKADIDLIVIGGPDLMEMEEVVSEVEKKINRSIHVYSFTLREVKERVSLKNPFIRRAVSGPKIVLIGDLDSLLGN